jgi:uncharacterized protein (TIGR02118 family)
MIRVSIFYPNTPESQFDLEYYLHTHIPKVEEVLRPLGLVNLEADRGIGTSMPSDPLPFAVVEHLMFNNFEEMQTALGEHGRELMTDVSNFTNVRPLVQINRVEYAPLHKEVEVAYN